MREKERLEPRTIRRVKGAVLTGLGLTGEKAAERLGIARATLYNDIDVDPDFFKEIVEFVTSAREEYITQELLKRKTSMSAEQRIQDLFGRAFAITEKVIQKAEAQGDAITINDAMEIHEKITVWAGKFVASEAPKRLQLDGKVNHEHTIVLHDDTVNAITAYRDHQAKMLPAGVIEAEVVPS